MSWCGSTSFFEGLRLQEQALQQVFAQEGLVVLLGMEHPPVVTLGIRGNKDEDIVNLNSEVEVVQTDRGGQATIHSPGQLVIYPVIHLEHHQLSIRCFVRLLEKVTQATLSQFGVETLILEGMPGLYVAPQKKIMFCGLRVSKGVTQHGISINISNDLSLFGAIKACGVSGAQVSSLEQETRQVVSPQAVFEVWKKVFAVELNLLTQGAKSCPAPEFARV